jgi:hypothetical protein
METGCQVPAWILSAACCKFSLHSNKLNSMINITNLGNWEKNIVEQIEKLELEI